MAIVDAVLVDAKNRIYKYNFSVTKELKRKGVDAPSAKSLVEIISEAVPVYNAREFLVESVNIQGWGFDGKDYF